MLTLIFLSPFLGFLINGLWYSLRQAPTHRPIGANVAGAIGAGAIGLSFLVSCVAALQLSGMPAEERFLREVLFSWISVPGLHLDFSLTLDSLSVLFVLVITGVGTLIHIYSIGYMAHDESAGKFFAYLNLFCAFMLVLVLGSSLPVLFLGWEGVGLCSYLLISYWYVDPEKASAGKKAFIVNRIGDLGFLLGMFLIFTTFGSLDFAELRHAMKTFPMDPMVLNSIGLLLFVGCTGKSAQIPLFVWLPDAMAGPTPVSALIHAATMVTSGIYLLARMGFLYVHAPEAMQVIAIVGAMTAFFAATIAVAQNDIKKVLAYSTVSQLGYMFLACGVGAFTSGVFHVMTHAFFKALLFLGAGSVIHGMHEEQDIRKMGGLSKFMPWTFLTFLIGWLAICGIPPLSGFFSKDEILWQVYASQQGSVVLWGLGVLTALMTAFYMSRLFVLTFMGELRVDEHHAEAHHDHHHPHDHGTKPHESPWTMLGPLVILAVLSALGGVLGLPHGFWPHYNFLETWLEPVVPGFSPLREGVHHETETTLMVLSSVVAVVGIALAWVAYSRSKGKEILGSLLGPVLRWASDKWYIDEIYNALIVNPLVALSNGLWRIMDVAGIDRFVLSLGSFSAHSGGVLRRIQTGATQAYLILLAVGLIAIVGYALYGMGL